ncbi:MAG: hypothetical protein M3518_00900, partial [Actinomycetota bacterium]|nr:hypothetical protein [Actinomycetota bacterium]
LMVTLLAMAPGAWAQETKKESPTRPQGLLTKPAKLDKKPLPPKPQAEEAGSDKIVAEKDSKGNLYASGELIVTYAADATAADEKKASEAVDARVDEDLPG